MLTWLPTVRALMKLLPAPKAPVVVRNLRRPSKTLRTLLVLEVALLRELPRLAAPFRCRTPHRFFRKSLVIPRRMTMLTPGFRMGSNDAGDAVLDPLRLGMWYI
jgi:hypothetical protein